MRIKNLSKLTASNIRLTVIRDHEYRCKTCGGRNNKRGYYTPSGGFIVCDDHMLAWAMRTGVKTTVIHLQIVYLDLDEGNLSADNLAPFCRKHRLEYIHERKRLQKLAARSHS